MEGLRNEATQLAKKYTRKELDLLMVILQNETYAKRCGYQSFEDLEKDFYFQGVIERKDDKTK